MSDDDNKPKRDALGRLLPGGPSLHPGGMPKLKAHFKNRCRDIVDDIVIDAWREEVLNRGEYWLKASALLAAYGYGLPRQDVKLEAERGAASALSADDLRALARRQLSTERRDDEPSGEPQH